ncbi:hypothetical protein [Actinomadura harenae]|uniref:Holin n=1 Tax=Actinomadura harenae TaxID=2483351 RepID=A0A3M2L611_9ACTN|nr:hypothetical protein [Actinomadura harenae]RMI31983.1 hypothetical protein EBO15_42360 [Actinomadura harenae]
MAAPIETKVKAASGASLVAGFVVGWLVLKLPALSSMAAPLQALVTAAVTAGFTFVAGWLAKHTPRMEQSAGTGGQSPVAPPPAPPEPPPATPPTAPPSAG